MVSKTGFSGLSDRQERGREEEWTEGRREEAREELKRGRVGKGIGKVGLGTIRKRGRERDTEGQGKVSSCKGGGQKNMFYNT